MVSNCRSVYEEIERKFTFPQEWLREIPAGTGYDELEKRGVRLLVDIARIMRLRSIGG